MNRYMVYNNGQDVRFLITLTDMGFLIAFINTDIR